VAELARSVGEHWRGWEPSAMARGQALIAAIAAHGYRGDRDRYDDLDNADLARVIDRRRGIPVSLGILYLAAGRAQGWELVGLNTPGHFLIRLDAEGGSLVIDPFSGKAAPTSDSGLEPDQMPLADDRAILIRLQNNIVSRLVDAERYAEAEPVLERMLWLAPATPGLLWQSALVKAEQGSLRGAIDRLDELIGVVADAGRRREAEKLRSRLHARLN
jgi:regulator of sirC expression with transglutaminase-like and TPR domain